MSLNYKVDLRKLRGKDLSLDLINEAYGEINELTNGRLLNIDIDQSSKTVSLKGRDMNNIIRQDTWDLKQYIKVARQYDKKMKQIAREKAKNGLDNYNYEQLDELVMKKSVMVKHRVIVRGLENRLETVKKVLKRDPITKLNKIEETGRNLDELRMIKLNSIVNPDEYMRKAGIDISKYRKRVGKKSLGLFGDFKSEKARKEYTQILSNMVTDEDYADSPDSGEFGSFFGYIYDNYVDPTTDTVRNFLKDVGREGMEDLMKEYVDSLKIPGILVKGHELDDLLVREDEEEEIDFRKALKRGKRK